MQERDIFLSALEIEDPQAREAHLRQKCAGDAQLLERVKSLLASHEGPSEFLNTPAVAQMADGAGADVDETMLHDDGSTRDDEADEEAAGRSHSSEQIPLGFLSPSTQPDSLGRLGHYEILEVVGRGAFGTVLRAFDEKLQRVVAIKVLAPEMAATSPARKRFRREAISSAALRHENVVSIYSVEDNPTPYLVMEYIPGKTLQERLDEQGPLDLTDVLRLGKQIADGLAAAHAEGLIHRDIKPGNILLEGGLDDRVKITDFGLARTADDASLTHSGVIAGTPMYMAPEQALGHKLDQRADLFSLGSVLYQMISGRPPFRAPTTMAVLKRVTEDTPRPIQEIIPETPKWICELVSHLHAKDPDERYGSAKEVSDLLGQCLIDLREGRTPAVPPPGRVDKASQAYNSQVARREAQPLWRRPFAKVAAVLILLLGGVSLLATQYWGGDPVENNIPEKANQISDFPPDSNGYKLTLDEYKWTPTVFPEPIQWPADAPPLAIAPFDAEQAKGHQQAWADYLGVPVEKEIVLGSKDNDGLDIKLKLVLIPPGEFLMGSNDEEIAKLQEQAKANGLALRDFKWIEMEGPQRRVRITRPFYVSHTEVTNDQFRSFVNATDFKTQAEASGKGSWTLRQGRMVRDPAINWHTARNTVPNSPVTHVTWNDANAYCRWLSAQNTELTFYLPTEAQWEYACRAGTTTAWFCGDDESVLQDYAVVRGGWRWVGSKKPNPFGLYDMHGNMWEWCRDSIVNYSDAGNVDPVGPDGDKRIIRGGNCFGNVKSAWHNGNGARSAVRYEALADHSVMDKSFRVVAAISEELLKAKSSPDTQTYISGEWIDVIPLIDPELDKSEVLDKGQPFTGVNDWDVHNGELLVGGADDKAHALVLPLDSDWPNFELEVELTQTVAGWGFCFGLPAGTTTCPIGFAWPNQPQVVLGAAHLKDAYPLAETPAIEVGKRTVLRIDVQRSQEDHVVLWRGRGDDAEKLCEWSGDLRELGFDEPRPGRVDGRRLNLVAFPNTRIVFHRIRVRVLDGGMATTLRPVPNEQGRS